MMKQSTLLNEILHGVIDNKAWAQESFYHWLMAFCSKSTNKCKKQIEDMTYLPASTIAETVCTDLFVKLTNNGSLLLRPFVDGDMEGLAHYVACSAYRSVWGMVKQYTHTSSGSDAELLAEEADQDSSKGLDLMGLTHGMVEQLVGKQRLVMQTLLGNLDGEQRQRQSELASAVGMTENQFNRTKHAALDNLKKMSEKAYHQALMLQDIALKAA